jgi:hypothetical protein
MLLPLSDCGAASPNFYSSMQVPGAQHSMPMFAKTSSVDEFINDTTYMQASVELASLGRQSTRNLTNP